MANQTGSAANPTDLLDKLRIFMVAQGWTQSFWAAEGTGYRLHLTKGGWYFNARSSPDSSAVWASSLYAQCPQISFNLSTALNTSNVWRDQLGAVLSTTAVPIGAGIALPAGAIQRYFFFYDPATDSLAVFVEALTGVWRWFGFGLGMIKQGAWTGGQWLASSAFYFYMSNSGVNPGGNTNVSGVPFGGNRGQNGGPLVMVNGVFDSFTGWLSVCEDNQTGRTGYTNVPGASTPGTTISGLQGIIGRSANALNSLDVLLPIQIFTVRDAGGYSLLGRLPNIFVTNPTGRTPGQAYALGSDYYVPFPSNTGTRGTAVKQV